MIKTRKIAGLLFVLGLMATMPAMAQQTPTPATETKQMDVSDAELTKFAQAFQSMRMVNQEAQTEMMNAVTESGMEVERFNEIHEASQDPQKEIDMTPEEEKMHKEVVAKLEGMQTGFQEKMEKVITDQGLTMDRYKELAMALQQSPELQQRLQKILEG